MPIISYSSCWNYTIKRDIRHMYRLVWNTHHISNDMGFRLMLKYKIK